MYLNDIREFDFKEVNLPNENLTLGEYLAGLAERVTFLNQERKF